MHLVRERILHQALAAAHIPLMIVRPCAVYGATDTHTAYGPNRFLRSALRERTIAIVGEGEEQRDHVYVEDLSRLIAWCAAHRTAGILNVATGRARSFAAVARVVAALFEEPVRVESLPRQQAVTHRHVDITALLRAFPSFRATPLSEGLLATYRRMTAEVSVGCP
jgi:nucleoside-diphosphate-sugar epimerase